MVGCKQQKTFTPVLADIEFIDSIKKLADTTYQKKQFTQDFANAEYYGIGKDSVLMQIMKDNSGNIRQVIVTRNNRRTHYSQYYNNGQLKALYAFDVYGSNSGESVEYYPNGAVKEKGEYKSGFRFGPWEMYDSLGSKTSTIMYDSNGQPQ